jgi:uncharacterized protein YndB with AHSA1/START domain
MTSADQETAVVRERTFDVPPDHVWETLTDEVLLEQWLADDVELDLREGGRARFEWEGGEAREAKIERVEPAERLSWWWWADGEELGRVDFRLEPAGGGTRLVVIETRPARSATAGQPWDIKLSALARMHAPSLCV